MSAVFSFLYQIHPLMPLAYAVVFCLGLVFPALYIVIKKKSFSIVEVIKDAGRGDRFARAVVAIYFLFVLISFLCVIGLLIKMGA